MKIDPLPKPNHISACPWCKTSIDWSGDEREEADCPACSKPIVLEVDRYDGHTIISAERSDTDLRYMKLMGIKDE